MDKEIERRWWDVYLGENMYINEEISHFLCPLLETSPDVDIEKITK